LEDGTVGNGLRAAERRFPSYSAEIRELISKSERFRETCDDLALAGEALAATDRMAADIRDQRRTEYQALVEALAKEVKDALREEKVIPITRTPKR
jgi:hypothetical protein